MNLESAFTVSNNWLHERMRSPYFGSVLTFWLFTNRKIMFGIFNFDEQQSLTERILWIQSELAKFNSPPVRFTEWATGLHGTLIVSLGMGFVLMLLYNLLGGAGEAIYKIVNRWTVASLEKVDGPNWIPKADHRTLRNEFDQLEVRYENKRSEALGLKESNTKLNTEVSSLETARISLSTDLSTANKLNEDLARTNQDLGKKHAASSLNLETLSDAVERLSRKLDLSTEELESERLKQLSEVVKQLEVNEGTKQITITHLNGHKLSFELIHNNFPYEFQVTRPEKRWLIKLMQASSSLRELIRKQVGTNNEFLNFHIDMTNRDLKEGVYVLLDEPSEGVTVDDVVTKLNYYVHLIHEVN